MVMSCTDVLASEPNYEAYSDFKEISSNMEEFEFTLLHFL